MVLLGLLLATQQLCPARSPKAQGALADGPFNEHATTAAALEKEGAGTAEAPERRGAEVAKHVREAVLDQAHKQRAGRWPLLLPVSLVRFGLGGSPFHGSPFSTPRVGDFQYRHRDDFGAVVRKMFAAVVEGHEVRKLAVLNGQLGTAIHTLAYHAQVDPTGPLVRHGLS